MIERYSRPKMKAIWSDLNRFKKYLDVEYEFMAAQVALKGIPGKVLDEWPHIDYGDVRRIQDIEETTKHEFNAFLDWLHECVHPEGKHIHLGLTSSDVQDTALALQLREAGVQISGECTKLLKTLKRRAWEFSKTPCVGRTHGMHAEPMAFGLKMALWYQHIFRCQKSLDLAVKQISFGKLSGPVGNYTNIIPAAELLALEELGLEVDPVATQVVQRDRHAQFVFSLAQLGSAIELIALEIRHLSRTEVSEVSESFSKGQKGSSAMPHKKNPISAENLCGISRLLRSYVGPALENVPLWHERDISHSSVERVILPDACLLADYAVSRMESLISNLEVNAPRMLENLKAEGKIVYSGALLIALVEKLESRAEAYKHVQRMAFESRESGIPFEKVVGTDKLIWGLFSREELRKIFEGKSYLKHTDFILNRAVGPEEARK